MKKLDWYILKHFLTTFFFAILLLAVVTAVIDFSENMDKFFSRNAPWSDVFRYYRNFLPFMVAFLFPLFIFISTIFFTSRLAYRSEIIAIHAAGVSFPRFLRPYVVGAFILLCLSLVVNHWIVPNGNKIRLMLEDKYFHDRQYSSQRNVHLRLSPELFVYLQSFDYTSNNGYRFTAEKFEGTLLKEKIFAERVSYDSIKKDWLLYNVTIRTNDSIKETLKFLPEMTQHYKNFSPADLDEDNDNMQAFNTPQLNKVIAREEERGRESLNYYYVEKYRRTAQPFAGLILTLIGASIASRRVRGGSGLHLAIGIIISATYILAIQFSTTFSTKAGLNPLIAVWLPNLLFSLVALYLYRRQVS